MRMIALVDRHRPARLSLARLFAVLSRLIRIRRERRALEMMDDHLLRDIGLTRDQARLEASRPVWDAPAAWRS